MNSPTGRNAAFITDFGKALKVCDADGVVMRIGRYGVWVYSRGAGKSEVVEVSDDLAALMERHQVSAERVVRIAAGVKIQESNT